jgi:hypothetical protein
MAEQRRDVRDMPYRRRHEGMSVLEKGAEWKLWATIATMLQLCVALPAGLMQLAVYQFIVLMIGHAAAMRAAAWNPLEPINKDNSNRGIDSFTEEECYRDLRFRKADLPGLLDKLGFANVVVLENGITCSGEYAMCMMLYRLHYPCTLASMQQMFGREFTQISRIFAYAIDLVFDLHADKVMGNIQWYGDRFDLYNRAYKTKIAQLPGNPVPGTVPLYLSDIFGSIDCTVNAICRPGGNQNIQNAFYNRYHHGHFIIWQGVTFPDGMVVLEGPEPGHYTDIMVWRDCMLRQELEEVMLEREALGLPRLYLYGDKIYNSGAVIKAAWSLRHGPLQAWMHVQNGLMARIRVQVEWAFERIVVMCKYASFSRTQMLQQSPLAKHYTVGVLLANCRTCMYGGIDTAYFGVVPPTLDEYFDQ